MQFSFKSLYTSVPVAEALQAVDKKLQSDHSLEDRCGYTRETVMAILKLCLDCTHFKFRENHYAIKDGLAMGSHVSSPVANLFMEKFEI